MATCSSCRWTGYRRRLQWPPPTVAGSRPPPPLLRAPWRNPGATRWRMDEALVRFVSAIGEIGRLEGNPPLPSPQGRPRRECPVHALKAAAGVRQTMPISEERFEAVARTGAPVLVCFRRESLEVEIRV